MTERGIVSAGCYAPKERVSAEVFAEAWGRFKPSGIEKKAVAAPDEDTVTMAYEAGKRALAAAPRSGEDLDHLAFATTTPPTAEEDPTVQLAEMFGVPDDASLQLQTGSTRAGTQALLRSLRTSPSRGHALVVASDAPRGEPETELEHAAGAAAAAFVVGPSPVATLRDAGRSSSLAQGVRFRRTGEEYVDRLEITTYERDAYVETISAAVDASGVEPSACDVAAIQAPDGTMPYRVGGRLGLDTATVQHCLLVHELGDLGAASVPVGLVRALEEGPDTTILAASFGSGAGADALVLDVTEAVPVAASTDGDRSLSYAAYLQRRGELTSGPPEGGGAYVSVPAWRRTIDQRYRLVAGECPNCEALNFPPSGACAECHERVSYDHVQLDPTGTVEAVTVISRGGAPPEFTEQQARSGDYAVAIVALDGPGGRTASVPAQIVDTEPDAVAVGDRIKTTIRRIYTQEGVTRYGLKVRPA